jgi:hypothetical protein
MLGRAAKELRDLDHPENRLRVLRVQRLRSRLEVFGRKNSSKKFCGLRQFCVCCFLRGPILAASGFAAFPQNFTGWAGSHCNSHIWSSSGRAAILGLNLRIRVTVPCKEFGQLIPFTC